MMSFDVGFHSRSLLCTWDQGSHNKSLTTIESILQVWTLSTQCLGRVIQPELMVPYKRRQKASRKREKAIIFYLIIASDILSLPVNRR